MADYQEPFGFGSFDEIFDMLNGRVNEPQPANQNSKKDSQTGSNKGNRRGSLLDEYGINMTDLAKSGKLDPVIGRDQEVSRVIEILNRRTKNNPVLIGEPGVGKTAVVEGLAQAIVAKKIPDKLLDKQVIRLDVVSLVQGTSMRGQFEERMQKLMKEVAEQKDVILFIDEIHEIMGAGNAEGGMDAGNILKPALARGDFQLVGATTLNEYRQIEKDGAIARRFQTVQVNEPNLEEAYQILDGLRSKYEDYHKVRYSDEVLRAAVDLSDRYVPERFLPDKAIDLIDEAGSKKNLKLELINPEEIQQKINNAEAMKQQAIDSEDYEKASYWRDQVTQLSKQKAAAETNPKSIEESQMISVDDLIKIIETKTDIPVGDLKENEASQLKDLDKNLSKVVIGQDEAVNKVAKAVRRNRIGLTKSGRPIGSFLFLGSTGVGKTETAKQLAKEVFGSTKAMIRFDMSEYMEKHSVSKLIGAPAGYIGHEEAGQLTEQVRRHPYSLILLDEIEKAHPDVLNMFLQILEDGRLTDAQGHTVSFKDTIIIATSNAGANDDIAQVGFDKTAAGNNKSIKNRLDEYFKPEFLNRFDAIVEFAPLEKEDLLKIVDLLIDSMNQMLADNQLHVSIDGKVKEKLVDLAYDPSMGARPLRRVLQEQIEDKVADAYLDNPDIKSLKAVIKNDQIEIVAVKNKKVSETASATIKK